MGKCLILEIMDFHSSKLVSYSLLIILALETTCSHALRKMPRNSTVPAVFVFGDSIVDPGNNNYVNTLVRSNFPPYGRDFQGGKPTGRFSNGKIPTDLLAEALGIKELVPPYLDPSLKLEDLLTGVSFASGASGYDPHTSETLKVLSPTDQLDNFREYIGKIKAGVGKRRAATVVSESVYVVCQGTDDLTNTYFGPSGPGKNKTSRNTVSNYTDFMIRATSTFLQELHNIGARKIGVVGLPPVGCVPSQRPKPKGNPNALDRPCSVSENQGGALYNTKLISLIASLNKKLPGVKLIYIDTYNSINDILKNYKQYGFEVATRACCGNGYLKVSILCNALSPNVCPDASKYVFWDSFHPTETASRILTRPIIEEYVKSFF